MAYSTDAARWRALTIRDANANGEFVYSVRTTNVYCRPTCPARLARRANVGFYKTPFEAEADGFRACKRCKPNSVLEDPQERAVEKACSLIEDAVRINDTKAIRLQDLAKKVGLTPRYLHKIFKDKTGVSPKEWAKARTTPNTASATPALSAEPTNETYDETLGWDVFNFNDFENLVDYDVDGSATLGYNLATGANEPMSMGYGNAIDVNILFELWNSKFEPNGVDAGVFLGSENFMSSLEEGNVDDLLWRNMSKQAPVVSSFEADAMALLNCNSVLF